MRNLDCNQIKIFINLEIIGEEEKNQIYIYIYIYFFFYYKKTKNISATWYNHLLQLWLLNPTLLIYTISKRILFFGLDFYVVKKYS